MDVLGGRALHLRSSVRSSHSPFHRPSFRPSFPQSFPMSVSLSLFFSRSILMSDGYPWRRSPSVLPSVHIFLCPSVILSIGSFFPPDVFSTFLRRISCIPSIFSLAHVRYVSFPLKQTIRPSFYTFFYPSSHPSIHPSVRPSVHPSIHPPASPPIHRPEGLEDSHRQIFVNLNRMT